MLAGILYLSQFRAGLIDARVQSLLVKAEIIAGAIAASATVETNAITVDPDRHARPQAGETYGPTEEILSGIEFPINPERARTGAAAADLADQDARAQSTTATACSRWTAATSTAAAIRAALRAGAADQREARPRRAHHDRDPHLAQSRDLPLYRELGPENGNGYQEVQQALDGK